VRNFNFGSVNMDYSEKYLEEFSGLAERQLRERLGPNDIIHKWSSLIEEIKGGYCSIHVELEHDLELIRGPIDTFIVDDNLNMLPDHQVFKDKISNLDQQYLELTQEYPKWKHLGGKWWSTRILKYASKEYVNFLYSHGVKDAGLTIQVFE